MTTSAFIVFKIIAFYLEKCILQGTFDVFNVELWYKSKSVLLIYLYCVGNKYTDLPKYGQSYFSPLKIMFIIIFRAVERGGEPVIFTGVQD